MSDDNVIVLPRVRAERRDARSALLAGCTLADQAWSVEAALLAIRLAAPRLELELTAAALDIWIARLQAAHATLLRLAQGGGA